MMEVFGCYLIYFSSHAVYCQLLNKQRFLRKTTFDDVFARNLSRFDMSIKCLKIQFAVLSNKCNLISQS